MRLFAVNFSDDRDFAPTNWLCICKDSKEEKGNIRSGRYEVNGDLKTAFGDLNKNCNLVDFFSAFLDRRGKLEEEDRLWQSSTATVDTGVDSWIGVRTPQLGGNIQFG